MASELQRRARENSTLKGRLSKTRKQSSDVLRGRSNSSTNVNSAASRLGASTRSGAGDGRGDGRMFGPPTPKRNIRITSPSEEWNRNGGPARLGKASGEEEGRPQFLFGGAPSLEQFLAAAASESGGAAYDARMADVERRKQEALRAIQFGSEDLARNIEASRGTISGGYDKALGESQQSLQQTQQAITQGQAATKQKQAQEFAALGLDARPNPNADSDAAFAQTILSAQNAAAQDALRANQASQTSLNTAYAGAARGRGQEDQNASRRNFDSLLAELQDAKAAAEAESRQRAQSTYQNAYSQWADQRDFAYREFVRGDENDRGDARWLLEQQMAAQANQPEVKLSPYQRYVQSQVSAGVTPETAGRWANNASVGARNKAPMEQWIGGGSPEARSNILEYLKSVGLI